MELSGIHTATLPLHIACMYHLKHLHSRLFILAHELVDKEPELPMSWLAVGVWYLISQKWRDARQYLSKATIMNPRLAPGWIAFAHTFALEGEHEHAITAYSTAARLFPGYERGTNVTVPSVDQFVQNPPSISIHRHGAANTVTNHTR